MATNRELRHRLETLQKADLAKKRNRHHAMIRNDSTQDAIAIFLASALRRGIQPLNVHHF
jgi:hypothetical protein